MNTVTDKLTRERSIFIANLVLDGNSKEKICETLNLNPGSVDRCINVVLPQVDKNLHEQVMNYFETQYKKNRIKQVKNELAKASIAVNALDSEENKMDMKVDKVEPVKNGRKNTRPDGISPEEFAIMIADYVIENNCSISEANRKFGLSSGNMHYVNCVLPTADEKKFKQVRNIVDSKKKQTTPANVTKNGLEKVNYEFKKVGGDRMHNSVAVCKYILDNNCSIHEAAKHFDTSENVITANVEYMKRLDSKKYEKVCDVSLRGNYSGPAELIMLGRGVKVSTYIKEKNAHTVCDYILSNNAKVSDAAKFFGCDGSVIRHNIGNMAECDYDKYLAVKAIQCEHGPNVKIKPNPKESTKDIENDYVVGEAAQKCFVEMCENINAAVEETVAKRVEEYTNVVAVNVDIPEENDADVPKEPEVKRTLWQKVKYIFGFGG